MRALLLFLAAASIPACNGSKSSDSSTVGEGEGEADQPTLVLTLASGEITAGEELGYTLAVQTGTTTTPLTDGALSSDLEPALVWDGDSLTPDVAGTQTLTASAVVDGATLETTATLLVDPAAAISLDLSLSALSFVAGDGMSYTVTALDAFGNAADTSLETFAFSSDGVDRTGDGAAGTLSGTVAGNYTLTATLGDLSDAEAFVVLTGPAVAIDLTLSDEDLTLGDSTTASAVVTDSYGNPTDDPWTLTVEGDGLTTIDGLRVTFDEEGWYTLVATVDGTDLSDSVGPLLVDSTGPNIVLDTPARGTWNAGLTGTVSGSITDDWSDIATATLNGTDLSLGSDGSFSTDIAYTFGTNTLTTDATDARGNASEDVRAVLAGTFQPYGEDASGGIQVRINQGAGGLDELEALGNGLVTSSTLIDLIPTPAYSYNDESCVDLGWLGTHCFTWYSVTLYLTSPSISGTDLALDPLSTGDLQATFTVDNPSVQWSATGVVAEISYSGSGSVAADSITAIVDLLPYVSDGTIHASVDSSTVTASGFTFDVDSWLYDALSYVGIDFNSMVEGYLDTAIENAISDQVPPLIEDTLQDLELGTTFAFGDRTYALTAAPDDISVDDTGITLSLGTALTVDEWESAYSGLGSLDYGYSPPTWSGSTGTDMGISADFLNQIFFAMWGGGLLDTSLTDEDLGVDPADLALFLPGLTDLTVTTTALLPPVVVPGTGDDLLDLQVGDLLITVYNGPADPADEYLAVYVSATAPMSVSVSADGKLDPVIGDPTMHFDLVYPDANSERAAAVEDLLTILVPAILPEFTSGLGEVSIPAISGYTLSDIAVTRDGAEGGYTVLSGSLVAE